MVFDDIDDNASQLDNLLLHPHSVFILASRNTGLLEQRCDAVEEVLRLRHGLDVQLSSAHAFAAGEPVSAVAALVPEVVASCSGLPPPWRCVYLPLETICELTFAWSSGAAACSRAHTSCGSQNQAGAR